VSELLGGRAVGVWGRPEASVDELCGALRKMLGGYPGGLVLVHEEEELPDNGRTLAELGVPPDTVVQVYLRVLRRPRAETKKSGGRSTRGGHQAHEKLVEGALGDFFARAQVGRELTQPLGSEAQEVPLGESALGQGLQVADISCSSSHLERAAHRARLGSREVVGGTPGTCGARPGPPPSL